MKSRHRSKAKPRVHAGDGLIDALAQSSFTIMAVLTEVAADNDLSLTQLRVLAILRDRRLGVSALARYLGLEKSTMSGLLDRAEKRGLLSRTASVDDGRATDVRLARDGIELAERVYAEVQRSLSPVIDALDPQERRLLQGLLEKVLPRVAI